jgi:hypothetical protein
MQNAVQKAGLVQAPAPETQVQRIENKLDAILAELQPITELFTALAGNPMLKQFMATK